MKAKRLILAVDRNPRNLELLAQFLGREGYGVLPAPTLEDFDRSLGRSEEVGLALVDIAGFDEGIWERCERLRAGGIPFLVLSARQSALVRQESLAHGARSVLVKPLVVAELLGVVRCLLGEGT
jgi:DNA-binding response OmpR family regulator